MTDLHLIVRRIVEAPPERVFRAWTEPARLVRWWGPPGCVCIGAQIDLRVGGRYRIGNDRSGDVLWIGGVFEAVEPPTRLVFTWAHEPDGPESRVEVRFDPHRDGTEVVLVHSRIEDAASRERHGDGWRGCLDGLVAELG